MLDLSDVPDHSSRHRFATWPILLGVLGALAAPLGHAQSNVAAPIYELDRIVAVVNDDVVVYSELLAKLRTVREQLRNANTPIPSENVLQRQVLDRVIIDKLQLNLAATNGMTVDDATLNRSVASLAEQNSLSLSEFRDILERDGYSFAKFREQIRNEILIGQVRQRFVNNRITVSQHDIDNYLATRKKQAGGGGEYHLAHILIAVPEGASPEEIAAAKVEATEVREGLRDGTGFAQTAVAHSDGQQALNGGDLGWRKAAELPTYFAEAVQSLKKGEISDPLRSPSGFHIVKLIEVKGEQKHVITQTQTRHILVRTNEVTTNDDARNRLEQIRERVLNGASFTELARAHSDDTGSAANGGDLGWINPGDLLPDFHAVMDSLAPSEISAAFRTQFGWHLVQVLERREYDGTQEVQRARAAKAIRARKVDEELQNWIRQIRDEAYVEYRLEER